MLQYSTIATSPDRGRRERKTTRPSRGRGGYSGPRTGPGVSTQISFFYFFLSCPSLSSAIVFPSFRLFCFLWWFLGRIRHFFFPDEEFIGICEKVANSGSFRPFVSFPPQIPDLALFCVVCYCSFAASGPGVARSSAFRPEIAFSGLRFFSFQELFFFYKSAIIAIKLYLINKLKYSYGG